MGNQAAFFFDWSCCDLSQPRRGATDGLAAASLRGRIPLFHQRENFRRRGIGRADVYPQWPALRLRKPRCLLLSVLHVHRGSSGAIHLL